MFQNPVSLKANTHTHTYTLRNSAIWDPKKFKETLRNSAIKEKKTCGFGSSYN